MLNDPDVYLTNVELGLWTPVPWYYAYFQAAERANCSPWQLIDDYTPREFWLDAALVVAQAEAEHSRTQQLRASAQSRSTGGGVAQRRR
jgi:hypothetical protein